jgi:ATP adenylyltransferase
MDYLWTPWRYHYVTTPGVPGDCVFCVAARGSNDKDRLVVFRAAHNFIILNRFPYTSGHIMVVPYSHVSTINALEDEALVELIHLTRECETCLRTVYQPDGLNIGMNVGKSAGAGVAAHIHMHVLPRWTGDVSFMTSVSETRVLPEALEVTWERLKQAFHRGGAETLR